VRAAVFVSPNEEAPIMKARSWLLAGVLVAAGLFGTARKADAQFYFNLGFGNYGGFYPGSYYSYSSYPYWGGYSPYSYLGGYGYGAPYSYRRSYYSASPFFGRRYGSYYYGYPGYGLGRYAYRWGRRWW
jgi:hypothetical protein